MNGAVSSQGNTGKTDRATEKTPATMKAAGGVMAEAIIRALPNGPYRVTGPAKVIDPLGNEIAIEEGRTISLCRCGGSTNKPYCDGSHQKCRDEMKGEVYSYTDSGRTPVPKP